MSTDDHGAGFYVFCQHFVLFKIMIFLVNVYLEKIQKIKLKFLYLERMKKEMKKQKSFAFGKDVYLLGKDADGVYYWLESAKWDCGWYWGFGYIETYTNNKNPNLAKDIKSHQHFDSLFFRAGNGYDAFKKFFVETTLTEKETWQLLEMMKTFYILREYSDTLNRGGAHYTANPLKEIIQNNDEYERINKIVLPELFNKIYELLED